jgi:hypothetical protein
LVTLVGVPGMGKTRLVSELFSSVEAMRGGVTWRQGRSLPYGDGGAFWALREIVKAQAGILESDSPGSPTHDSARQSISWEQTPFRVVG